MNKAKKKKDKVRLIWFTQEVIAISGRWTKEGGEKKYERRSHLHEASIILIGKHQPWTQYSMPEQGRTRPRLLHSSPRHQIDGTETNGKFMLLTCRKLIIIHVPAL